MVPVVRIREHSYLGMSAYSRYELIRALESVFGAEWSALSPADRRLILRDCTEEGGVSDFAQYRSNIGAGNLQAYADCMRVRFTRKVRTA